MSQLSQPGVPVLKKLKMLKMCKGCRHVVYVYVCFQQLKPTLALVCDFFWLWGLFLSDAQKNRLLRRGGFCKHEEHKHTLKSARSGLPRRQLRDSGGSVSAK